MKRTWFLTAAFLTLTAAQATATTPTTTASTTVATQANLNLLVQFLRSGGKVELVDASGNVVATLNADGTWTAAAGTSLSTATVIRVTSTTAAGATTSRDYTLSRTLDRPGMPKVALVNANGKVISVALPAAMNRQTQSGTGSAAPAAPTAPATGVTTAATTVPKANIAALLPLLKSGGKVELVDASGVVIATLNANGSWTVASGADLSAATAIRVSGAGTGGATSSRDYTLTRGLDKSGMPKVAVVNANGKSISLALPAAMKRPVNAGGPAVAETDAMAPRGKGSQAQGKGGKSK